MNKQENTIKSMVVPIVKTVIAVAAVTVIMLLILSLLLYKLKFGDKILLVGIGVIYFVSNLVGGFIIGKVKEQRRFLWGLAVGVTYFLVLTLVSFFVTGEIYQGSMMPVAGFLCCATGGMAGGMLS